MHSVDTLFIKQKELDNHILTEKGLKKVPLNNLILATIAEIGEAANEWQGFKHWKMNPHPKAGLLEELADVLHFILSIGNQLYHREPISIYQKEDPFYSKNAFEDITEQLLALTSDFTDLWNCGEIEEGYSSTITKFAILTEMLGFAWDQIEQAYFAKNKVNHARQENGY